MEITAQPCCAQWRSWRTRVPSAERRKDLKNRTETSWLERAGRGWGGFQFVAGCIFGGMADAPACATTTGASELAAIFEAGLAAVRKQTKAQPGDKTMMDALVPAIEALRGAANSGKSVFEALHDAAEAALAGAEATRDFTARYGRAKFLGEKTRGHVDPGAALHKPLVRRIL